jgi:exosome complex component CSL4
MIEVLSSGSFVCPGDVLVTISGNGLYDPCGGCFVEEGSNRIRASIAGRVLIEEELGTEQESRFRVSVSSARSQVASETVIDVGDKVTCRVVRISMNQANLEIISVGDCPLQQSPKGIIRREDVRLSDIEKLIMSECFRPGDILRGVIISLGDSRQYYVSTSDADHGVLYAKSLVTGNLMDPVSHKVSSTSNFLMNSMASSTSYTVLSASHCFVSNRLCYGMHPSHFIGNG